MKERINPWGEKRQEKMQEIPLRHLEQGVMGMHEILELFPEVRLLVDSEFKERLVRRMGMAAHGVEDEEERRQRQNDAYDAFMKPLSERAHTSDEHERVNKLIDDLVGRWRHLCRSVKVDTLTVRDASVDFLTHIIASSEVRRIIWEMGCDALRPLYDVFELSCVSSALRDENNEFYFDGDEVEDEEEYDEAYERAAAAYRENPEKYLYEWGLDEWMPDYNFETVDDSIGVAGLFQHLVNEDMMLHQCTCDACMHFRQLSDEQSVARNLASFLFNRDFGETDAERALIVAMFKQHVGTQDYADLRFRAQELTKRIPDVVDSLLRFSDEWCAYLVENNGLNDEEAEFVRERVSRALAYVQAHAVVVNADEMESDLHCIAGDYNPGTHVIRVQDELHDYDRREHDDSVISHELIHAASGHGLVHDADRDEVRDISVGLLKQDRFAWLNEAFTEFLNQCSDQVRRSQPIDIRAACEASASYEDERELLLRFFEHPDVDMHALLGRLTLAMFEDVGTGEPVQYFHEMNRMLSDVFGKGFLVSLDDYIQRVTYKKQQEDHTATWGHGVEVVVRIWNGSLEKFGDYRFAQQYLSGGLYKDEYEKVPKDTKKETPQ